MSAPQRPRDISKVARGEQAPRPVHEYGTVSKPPPPSSSSASSAQTNLDGNGDRRHGGKDEDSKVVVVEEGVETAPNDMRFPFTNQTRHCYTRYLDYHSCVRKKGEHAPECHKFAKYYRSLCPAEWIEKWNEQRELGIFPGPI
ncbi:cytochrome c oxidase subunit 6b-3-like isoform X2 [Cucurbita pepo subsp. pepo]|uniref:cytochrome c oxidase subunit 6b-3-like isoform X2 n=1 Tax=Cucurbita pepo subsp. pepo TaxID=3664 RepID=UPI000C9D597E|nr:cytochrome c oxidase subunit 6b-3-like isoform X2 [Cucurbita pepo subsp. pepo]